MTRARGHLGRREFAEARRLLADEAIPRWPDALWPRQILSHVLLQEGRDWDGAERELGEMLRIDPNHREAKNNLALLLRQREQVVQA